MSPFQEAVLRAVRRIPSGKVTSYGAVAAMAGQPRAARGVGWILNRLGPETDLPWWRVVNRDGGLGFKVDLTAHQAPGETIEVERMRITGPEGGRVVREIFA